MTIDLSKEGAIGTYTWEDRDLVNLKPAAGFFEGKPSVKWAVFEKATSTAPEPQDTAFNNNASTVSGAFGK